MQQKPQPKLVVTSDGSFTLLDPVTGALYHSIDGALSESTHVYIAASQIAEKLQQQPEVRVLEVGTGTGLNFILALQEAHRVLGSQLVYQGFEPHPIDTALLTTFFAATPLPVELWQAYLDNQITRSYSDAACKAQFYEQPFAPDTPAAFGLIDWADVLFFDAFGPGAAPEMWKPEVLGAALSCLGPGGCCVTFSITGDTKRFLRAEGYAFDRLPGFGRKREMLRVWAK